MGESVRIWRSTIDDFTALVGSLSDSQWGSATPCPGWSVSDVVAHVIDLEVHFLGEDRPDHQPDWMNLPHVRTEMQQFIEVGVDARRGRSPSDMRDELTTVIDRRSEQLQETDLRQEVQWFVGEITVERLLWMRCFDIWTHEQDIRAAIGEPGGFDTTGAHVAWQRIRETLPYIWGKKVSASGTLALDVAGPGPSGVLIVTMDGDRAVYSESAVPDVRVGMTWVDLAARAAGRISAEDVHVTIEGDQALGRRFLEELAFTP